MTGAPPRPAQRRSERCSIAPSRYLCSGQAANFGQFIGGIAGVVTTKIALIAAVVAWRQLHVARSIEREAIARQGWKDYLRLCVEHPALARGIGLGDASDDIEWEKYERFVSLMLDAAEGIVLHVADTDEWIPAVEDQIGFHAAYVGSEVFATNYMRHYSRRFQEVILEALAKSGKKDAALLGIGA